MGIYLTQTHSIHGRNARGPRGRSPKWLEQLEMAVYGTAGLGPLRTKRTIEVVVVAKEPKKFLICYSSVGFGRRRLTSLL